MEREREFTLSNIPLWLKKKPIPTELMSLETALIEAFTTGPDNNPPIIPAPLKHILGLAAMRATSLLLSCHGLNDEQGILSTIDVKTLQDPNFMPSRVLCGFNECGDTHIALWLATFIPNGDAT
eukprot:122097_1